MLCYLVIYRFDSVEGHILMVLSIHLEFFLPFFWQWFYFLFRESEDFVQLPIMKACAMMVCLFETQPLMKFSLQSKFELNRIHFHLLLL